MAIDIHAWFTLCKLALCLLLLLDLSCLEDNRQKTDVAKIVHLVRKFILAYIRGEITFDLIIKPDTYKTRLEMDGMHVDEAQKLFFQIPNTMLKCAGLEEEYDACIGMLFKFMILGRATKSIDG
jgi:hypothetical protein